MRPLLLISFLFSLLLPVAKAQDTAICRSLPPVKQIEVVGKPIVNPHAIFVGEVHGIWEGWPFESEMIRWAHKNYGTTDVVMEWGKSEAYLFNAYLQRGDTAILAYYGREKSILDQLAKWQALYDECKFTLHGLDFERSSFGYALLSILGRDERAKRSGLYNYLSSELATLTKQHDDKSGKKTTVSIYNRARDIFRSEKDSLGVILKSDIAVVGGILENPAQQDHFKKRDEAMAENLGMVDAKSNGFISIAGMGHTTLHKNSVMKRYVDTHADRKVAVVNMVCKNCYTTSYFGSLVIPIIADYEEKNGDYMLGIYDKYCRPGFYSLIDQDEFVALPGGYNPVPTYYVLFKDQPRWY